MRMVFRGISLLLTVGLLVACERETVDKPLPMGHWRAALELPGGSAAFGLELGREGEGLRATLLNGQERVPVPIARYDTTTKSLELSFPAYGNAIAARFEDGRLLGTLTLSKRDTDQNIPFSATHGNVSTSQALPTNLDVSGRWAVSFTEEDDSQYPAIGEFAQRGSRLIGTFMTAKGDYRFLGGEMRGNGFVLSTFDGAHAFLFKAESLPDGTLIGEFWSGLKSYETFVASADENAALPDPNSLTFLNPGFDRLEFSLPNPGGEPVSLSDATFEGKVVIVTLAGSWCPNCHDEAAFMAPLYEKYREQGLEIIALMFEHSTDFATAATQVQRFRDKFGLQYQTLVAGSSDKEEAAKVLPALNHVLAFPTTIFIDRRGNVRRIHTGFTGPGTGEHFKRQSADFIESIEALLAESAEPPPPPIEEPETTEADLSNDETVAGAADAETPGAEPEATGDATDGDTTD